MLESLDLMETEELQKRWQRCRSLLQERDPRAEGLLLLAPHSIYWCSGHLANGALWLPLEGEPLLLVRKGLERAGLESTLQNIHHFRSFKDLPRVMAEAGYAVPTRAAAELSGMSWAMGRNLESRLQEWTLSDADPVLARARAVKTQRELKIMRLAGERQRRCMEEELPQRIAPGMSERDIGGAIWQEFFRLGHQGITRMSSPGSELVVGQVSAGDSGIYPTTLNGPVGQRGQHPAAPLIGYSGKLWQQGEILTLDTVFFLEGYHTDKTLVYFAGQESEADSEIRSAQSFCRDLQHSASRMLRPGVTPAEIYSHCAEQARKHGYEKGFMGLGENKVPFLGHGIGLLLDDYPPLAEKFSEPLQEDMVLALEPKVGVPGQGMAGVENTFRVTQNGGEPLTGDQGGLVCL